MRFTHGITGPLACAAVFTVVGGTAMAHDSPADAAEMKGVTVTGPVRDEKRSVDVLTVTSPFVGKPCRIDVLLPDKLRDGKTYPVLYMLPVGGEWNAKPPWGYALAEARRADAHNRHGVICVLMQFDAMPWYGSHATNKKIRHEEHIRKVVVPAIEEHYPASRRVKDRLLFGFSKSGWGAVTLLLRNADVFGAACSWDAPLCFTKKDFGKVGTRPHFGTAEQMAKYLPLTLAEQRVGELTGGPPRLMILGHSIWWNHSSQYAKHLKELGIPHVFDDSLRAKHTWTSKWLPKALDMFLTLHAKPAK